MNTALEVAWKKGHGSEAGSGSGYLLVLLHSFLV